MTDKELLSVPQYERMADHLQKSSEMIRARPELNHQFADRLTLLSKDMREDGARVYPEILEAYGTFAHAAEALKVIPEA